MDEEIKIEFLTSLILMKSAAERLKELYKQHPELSDQVNMENIILTSFDEWYTELEAKIEEIRFL